MDERDPSSNVLDQLPEDRGGEAVPTGAQKLETLMVFRRGDHWYALRALEVRAVVPSARPVALPRTPGFVRGVVNHGGRIAPVLDLPLLLRQGGIPDPVEGRALVLEVQTAQFIVECDEVAGLSEVDPEGLRRAEGEGPAIGSFLLGERLVTLLDGERILSAAEAGGGR